MFIGSKDFGGLVIQPTTPFIKMKEMVRKANEVRGRDVYNFNFR